MERDKRTISKLFGNAVSFLLISFIRFYRYFVSPIFPKKCRFYPSCSVYAIQAIRRFGPLEGFLMAMWRIVRCAPWSRGGYDPPIKSPLRESVWKKM